MAERRLSTARLRSTCMRRTTKQFPTVLSSIRVHIVAASGSMVESWPDHPNDARAASVHPLATDDEPATARARVGSTGRRDWLWAFMFLTDFPSSRVSRRRFPLIVVSLLLLCVMMFAVEMGGAQRSQVMP